LKAFYARVSNDLARFESMDECSVKVRMAYNIRLATSPRPMRLPKSGWYYLSSFSMRESRVKDDGYRFSLVISVIGVVGWHGGFA
jgi:hypothetical protein